MASFFTDFSDTLVYAAWHDAGTYNKHTGTGGATGTIRFDQEMSAGPNAGLDLAAKLLKAIKSQHPDVSWADLYQMCSAAAIEVSTI
jgi:L-ascorbate peroxidase